MNSLLLSHSPHQLPSYQSIPTSAPIEVEPPHHPFTALPRESCHALLLIGLCLLQLSTFIVLYHVLAGSDTPPSFPLSTVLAELCATSPLLPAVGYGSAQPATRQHQRLIEKHRRGIFAALSMSGSPCVWTAVAVCASHWGAETAFAIAIDAGRPSLVTAIIVTRTDKPFISRLETVREG